MGSKARTITLQQAVDAARHLRQPRDVVLFWLLTTTGARIGEAVQLHQADAYHPTGEARELLRIRPEVAKYGQGGDQPINNCRRGPPRRTPPPVEQLQTTRGEVVDSAGRRRSPVEPAERWRRRTPVPE